MLLERGSRVPHFSVRTTDGVPTDYRDIWQRRNLLLLSVADSRESRDVLEAYTTALSGRARDLALYETTVILTHDRIDGLPSPGVLIADRWGEVYFVYTPASVASMPAVDDLVDGIKVIAYKC
jgi:hypothetical protein